MNVERLVKRIREELEKDGPCSPSCSNSTPECVRQWAIYYNYTVYYEVLNVIYSYLRDGNITKARELAEALFHVTEGLDRDAINLLIDISILRGEAE